MITEIRARTSSGYSAFIALLLALLALFSALFIGPVPIKIVAGLLLVPLLVCWAGFYMVAPNEGRVLQLFGKYVGTDKVNGLRWANPLYSKSRVSLRVRNFESGQIKVNDLGGNPIEIASVVVWKVVDAAEAVFEVDNYEGYVAIQTEAAIRNMATSYPYDDYEEHEISLRGNSNEIAVILKQEVQERLGKAGVEVLEARISHLAYAPEIASAMLQRQQASAIVAARHKIVEGAVGMVEAALDKLAEKEIIELDEERKATMVSNLLVVLCGDKATQPVINTGSLYR
ncbi:SPFH domain-containing protein [Teredinibacter haidensis]|uniref:SPFH domain-containing protein n=1 Tax=Teredinibacter haidensis TaxID=2731755 RepID=UPI000948DE84|nr:SPFH domain-containing protein [Teredinibacter haidensis]